MFVLFVTSFLFRSSLCLFFFSLLLWNDISKAFQKERTQHPQPTTTTIGNSISFPKFFDGFFFSPFLFLTLKDAPTIPKSIAWRLFLLYPTLWSNDVFYPLYTFHGSTCGPKSFIICSFKWINKIQSPGNVSLASFAPPSYTYLPTPHSRKILYL